MGPINLLQRLYAPGPASWPHDSIPPVICIKPPMTKKCSSINEEKMAQVNETCLPVVDVIRCKPRDTQSKNVKCRKECT